MWLTETLSGSRARTAARAAFIKNTYAHLFGAVALFVAIEYAMFETGVAQRIARALTAVPWLTVLGAYMIVAWFASRYAHRSKTRAGQYAGLIFFVAAKAVIFVPLIYYAERRMPGTVASAAYAALFGFASLSAVAWVTRHDFSFLRGTLIWGGLIALTLIVVAFFTKLQLGAWFSAAMIIYAGLAVLYDTSNVIHRFSNKQYVGASLQLFASVTLMLWYLIRWQRHAE